ncbi:uncharacterized protein FA14DRAFT_176546 [Meira miltonrushii]|uniref:HTH APSES-type domain-containing protein n=1 Tax=Meira miltonrushii TaxID=1280837 RepID=A0A316VJL0_9BASI|nr:uncharacterized protein FA14DRAFT_176546 [Meira miltonrushii]PWN37248.1 hypothetical protein FA14DRAFT_176546 [Meira miltonrushii]
MAGSRKSTPSRARSSSVTSNVSTTSNKPKATPKSPKSPRSPKEPKLPKAPKASASPSKPTKTGPATPRKSKSASKAAVEELTPAQIAAVQARPPLDQSERNSILPDEDIPVKLQVIQREGANIIIGRVKLPAPVKNGHGFILKRFDTNAIAASSMFRLAYPHASLEHEAEEMQYLEQRYETDLANGGHAKVPKKPRGRPSKKALEAASQELQYDEVLPAGSTGVRLQGTWIPSPDAMIVAAEYGLERWARPLIEAKATESDSGTAILTPAKGDKVSTPTSGRSKKILQQVLENPTGSPTSILRAAKRSKDDGSQEVSVDQKILQSGLSAEQIAKQIKDSQALAKNVQAKGASSGSASLKRRAANQNPSANNDEFDESEDYENANVVVRSLRRGQRVVRRRPIATTAGALGAVGAVGAGTLAWVAGGNLDIAVQLVQQGVQNLSSWFF